MSNEEKLAALLKSLGDPNRLKILRLLAGQPSPLCVGALARSLKISQPAISQHLRVLRGLNLVKGKRMGVHVHYQVNESQLLAAQTQIDRFLEKLTDSDLKPSQVSCRGKAKHS